jgi:phosphoesterase RecJ-like protein
MADALGKLGKQVRMVVASNLPPRYDFLNPDGAVAVFHLPGDAYADAEVIIVLDTGTWNQIGDFGKFMQSLDRPKVVIDHHPTQDDLGGLRFVDTTAEATGRLVFEAAQALGVPLSERSANDLFTAVAMDTGWFRHSNTSPATFTLAADLTRAGARPAILYDQLFEHNTLPRLKLMGRVLERMQLEADGKIAWTDVRRADFAETGALPQDSEDLIGFTRSISGVEVGLLFVEQPRGITKISFRSRSRVDVGRIAEQFGGGGHRLASGAKLEAPLDEARARVLAAVHAAVAGL